MILNKAIYLAFTLFFLTLGTYAQQRKNPSERSVPLILWTCPTIKGGRICLPPHPRLPGPAYPRPRRWPPSPRPLRLLGSEPKDRVEPESRQGACLE